MAKNKKTLDKRIEGTIKDAVFYDDGTPPFAYPGTFNQDNATPQVQDVRFRPGNLVQPEDMPEVVVQGSGKSPIVDILKDRRKEPNWVMKDGKIILPELNPDEVRALDTMFQELELGTLDQYTGTLENLMKNVDGKGNPLPFDAPAFSDLIGKAFQPKIDEVAEKFTFKELKDAAKKLDSPEFYTRILKAKPGELSKPVFFRALVEARLVKSKLDSFTNYMLENGVNAENSKVWMDMHARLQLLFTKSGAEVRLAYQKGRIYQEAGKGMFGLEEWEEGMEILADNMARYSAGEIPPREVMEQNLREYSAISGAQKEYSIKEASKRGPTWWDAIAEVYVNSKLYHPWTLIVNMGGNATMALFDTIETLNAGLLNRAFGGDFSETGVHVEEALGTVLSLSRGFNRGLETAGRGVLTGETIGNAMKIDQRYEGNALSGRLVEGTKMEFLGKPLDYIGTIANVPKHAMIWQDEFTKGVIFDMELGKIAHREKVKVLRRGGTEDDAQAALERILLSPDDEHIKAVESAMAVRTFQNDLPDGIFKNLQKYAQKPGVRFVMPFYKTLVNIFFETSKRNPVLGWAMPSVRKDLSGKNGKYAQQMAISRMGTGVAFAVAAYNLAYDPTRTLEEKPKIVLTGAPPTDKKDLLAYREGGFIPYSVGVLNEETGEYTMVNYSKIEPVGRLLAMATDIATIAQAPTTFTDGEVTMEDLARGFLNASHTYFTEQPFIDVFSQLDDMFGAGYGTTADKAGTAIVRKLIDIGGSVISPGGRSSKFLPNISEITGAPGSEEERAIVERLNSYIDNYDITNEQYYDPTYTATLFGILNGSGATTWEEMYDGDIPVGLNLVYRDVNKFKVNHPAFNTYLEDELMEFGRKRENPTGDLPVAVGRTDSELVYNYLLGTGLLFEESGRKLSSGLSLTNDERNAYMRYLNEDEDGDGESDYLVAMRNEISQSDFLDLGQKYDYQGNQTGREEQKARLSNLRTEFRSKAEQKLLADPNFIRLADRHYSSINAPTTVGNIRKVD